jgi:hypothetical protein
MVFMDRHAIALTALLSSLALAPAQSAFAQDADFPMDTQVAVKLMLGLGGDVEIDPDGTSFTIEDDLDVTWGGGVHILCPVIKWFAIGGQVAVQSWSPDNADDSNVLLDIVALPAGLLPLTDSVQLTLSVPLGISLDFVGDDAAGTDVIGAEVTTGFGFTIGIMLGAQFAVSDGFGVLAELGYVGHGWTHEVEASAGPLTTSSEFELNTSQFALNLGVYF